MIKSAVLDRVENNWLFYTFQLKWINVVLVVLVFVAKPEVGGRMTELLIWLCNPDDRKLFIMTSVDYQNALLPSLCCADICRARVLLHKRNHKFMYA